ncbi:hypothetical protein Tco_0543496 [Tanacetum coccineum]
MENLVCPLCSKSNDSHNHLFFKCEFSTPIWDATKRKMNAANATNEWDQIVQTMGNFKCSNSIWSVLRRIGLAACVYYVWKERNDRIFTQIKKSYQTVLQHIMENIRLHLMSLSVKKSANTVKVADLWNSSSIFLSPYIILYSLATAATMAINCTVSRGSNLSVFVCFGCSYEKDLDFEFVSVDYVAQSRAITKYVTEAYADKGTVLMLKDLKKSAIQSVWMEVENQQFDHTDFYA